MEENGLTHFMLLVSFYTLWKHQTVQFALINKGWVWLHVFPVTFSPFCFIFAKIWINLWCEKAFQSYKLSSDWKFNNFYLEHIRRCTEFLWYWVFVNEMFCMNLLVSLIEVDMLEKIYLWIFRESTFKLNLIVSIIWDFNNIVTIN